MKIKKHLPPTDRKLRQPEVLTLKDLIIDGFEIKVNKNAPGGCWYWTGSTASNGYGKFSFLSKTWSSHRISWLLFKGPIKKGLFLCHRCDQPKCVNPDHLFLGTPKQNTLDMIRKKRHRADLHPESYRKERTL